MDFFVATFSEGDSMCLWANDEQQARELLARSGAGRPERLETRDPAELAEYRLATAPPERPKLCGWHAAPVVRQRARMDALVSYANVGAVLVAVDHYLPEWPEAVRLVVSQRVLDEPRLLGTLFAGRPR